MPQRSRKQRGGLPPIVGGTERYTQLDGHPYVDLIYRIATANRRVFPLSTLAGIINGLTRAHYRPAEDRFHEIRTFDELCGYVANFIRNSDSPPYGIILHPSPINNETTFIQRELFITNSIGFVTLDSQIGAVTQDEDGVSTLNRPYIQLLMPRARLVDLRAAIAAHPRLCEVDYPDQAADTLINFPAFADAHHNYATMYIGLHEPSTRAEYTYILHPGNPFFEEVNQVLANLPVRGGRRRSRRTRRSRR